MEQNKTVLVTGGNGFIALHIILLLLKKNYTVKTTIRNTKHIATIKQTLLANGVTNINNLTFVEAELTQDTNWENAMENCTYVLSVASPVFFNKTKNEKEAIKPATEGIIRILKFAKQANVKRVVMTSNFGAIGFTQTNNNRLTTEEDWTDTNVKGVSVYEKSKTLAEKAAWKFIKEEGNGLEFATINPVAILGPALNAHISGSFILIENLINGTFKTVPNIPLNIIDVRDVAQLHIKAMETAAANGQRFIASADGQISLPQMAALLIKQKPQVAEKVARKILPNWILKVGALFNHKAQEGLLLSKINRNIDTTKAKNLLGYTPKTTKEEAILLAVETMEKYNLINPTK